MSSLGIIANPASGKDIRRLVSYATIIDNQGKENIIKRLVVAAQSLGVDEILFMPDSYHFGEAVIGDLRSDQCLPGDDRGNGRGDGGWHRRRDGGPIFLLHTRQEDRDQDKRRVL